MMNKTNIPKNSIWIDSEDGWTLILKGGDGWWKQESNKNSLPYDHIVGIYGFAFGGRFKRIDFKTYIELL